MRLSTISLIVFCSMLIVACTQSELKPTNQAPQEEKGPSIIDRLTPVEVKIITLPNSSSPDENFTIAWQVTGSEGSEIPHTAIHYDSKTHDADFQLYPKASTYMVGTTPKVFSVSIKATKEKYMYIRAHAVVNGKHYYDDEKVVLIALKPSETLLPPPPAPVPILPSQKEFVVEADDDYFYPKAIDVIKGDQVKLTLKVRDKNVYYGGLLFTSDDVNYDSGDVLPGEETIYEFTANKSFTITSWWPSSRRYKAEIDINVK